MKLRSLSFLATAVAAAAILTSAVRTQFSLPVVHAHHGCSNATLIGNYAFSFSGFSNENNTFVPFDGAGIANFDGAGNVSATFAYSSGGTSSTGNPYTATYSVDSNCAVSLTATPGSGGDNFAGAIVRDGDEILTTDISAPDTLTLNFKRQ
jgi:hypothetical protein